MNTTDHKYPVAVFELIPRSKSGSGFVRNDTIGTQEEIRIIHPKNRVIINRSFIKMRSEDDPNVMVNVPTRYIYNQQEIFIKKQEAANMNVSDVRDKINFINGLIIVPKDGAFVGLYNFMTKHAQNATNPEASKTMKMIFREVKPAAQAHDKNVSEFHLSKALGVIYKMVKEKDGKFQYDEAAIDTLCANMGVNADGPEQKVAALTVLAKSKPLTFLNLVETTEQTVSIEIKHALQLKLINIEGTAIFYSDGTKIKQFSNAQNTDSKKMEALGSYFSKVEGKDAYELFRAKLEAAKAETLDITS